MQDPSFGVSPPLTQHVHLISNQQFPVIARLTLQQVFKYLYDAPQTIKHGATMSWRYLTAPKDGTIFLTWISPRHNDQFPSDGYMWAGSEERIVQEIGGYTIEILVHNTGYQPGIDAMANHRRARYRLVAKNPTVNANPPDRSLWLVHYSQSDPHKVMAPMQIQMSPLQQAQHQQRAFIEREGQLEHKEFMLHDRDRWPVVKTVRSGSQGMTPARGQAPAPNAMAHMANPRFGGQHYQQQAQAAVGPSPAKRQRTSMTGPMQAMQQMPEYRDIEAEDEYASGDYLDMLTQRDVSKARYIQHHEWMEEVISSPHASSQIEPVYLGFGLMGELAGLTKGVFEVVEKAAQQYQDDFNVNKMTVVPAKVSGDQVKEFEKRVTEYLDEGQAEIKRMKEEHARKMDAWRKGKVVTKAEKRLRNARWVEEGQRQSPLNGLASGRKDAEDANAIISDIEKALGTSIADRPLTDLVERGGLKDKVVQPEPEPEPMANGFDHANGHGQDAMQTSAPSQPQQSYQQQQQAAPSTTQPPPAQNARAQPAQQQPAPPTTSAQQPQSTLPDTSMDFPTDDQLDTMDTSNFEMEDLDIDMDNTAEFTFDDPLDTATPQAGAQSTAQPPASTAQNAAAPPQQSLDPANGGGTTAGGNASGGADLSFHPTPGDNSAFDEFTAGDDGFVDFGDDEGLLGDAGEKAEGDGGRGAEGGEEALDLDLGMDGGGAFGEAFHGLGGSGEGTPAESGQGVQDGHAQ